MPKYRFGSYLFLSIKRYTTDVNLIQMCSLVCVLSIDESPIVLTVYLTEPLPRPTRRHRTRHERGLHTSRLILHVHATGTGLTLGGARLAARTEARNDPKTHTSEKAWCNFCLKRNQKVQGGTDTSVIKITC